MLTCVTACVHARAAACAACSRMRMYMHAHARTLVASAVANPIKHIFKMY